MSAQKRDISTLRAGIAGSVWRRSADALYEQADDKGSQAALRRGRTENWSRLGWLLPILVIVASAIWSHQPVAYAGAAKPAGHPAPAHDGTPSKVSKALIAPRGTVGNRYSALLITRLNGTHYMPRTTVKNRAQARLLGVVVGTHVPIAVPPGIYPQAMVNSWHSGSLFNSYPEFAWTWRPGGPNDYKLISPIYDAYGNFEYGATGAAAGFSCTTLQAAGDVLHGGQNNPINTKDIQAGCSAVYGGRKQSTRAYNSLK